MKQLSFFIVLLLLLLGPFWTADSSAGDDAQGELVVEVETSVLVKNQDAAQARSEAVKGALQRAVEQATGTLLAPETMAAKSKILKESLFPKADQYIQNYRIVGEHVDSNVYTLVLRVTVALEGIKNELLAVGLGKELQRGVPLVPVAVMISGIKSYEDYRRFKEFIKAGIKGVEAVRPRSIAWRTATMEVDFRGEAAVLAAELSRTKQFPIRTGILADNSLEVMFIK